MKQKHSKKPQEQRRIAKERINILFEQAKLRFKEDSSLSDRYVEIARKIAMKYKVRIPRELKRRFCKHCHKYLVPGANSSVRLTQKKVVYYCLNCKKYMRFPYNKKAGD
ncbi:ribonuclease P [Candidatus Woesearchaeota archaeon]|nr:ribonuclease P [Candidatus Woesearchaeota archaeon]